MNDEVILSEGMKTRCNQVFSGLNIRFQGKAIREELHSDSIDVFVRDTWVCSVTVKEDGYQLSFSNREWCKRTTFSCEDLGEKFTYYVNSTDECLGEIDKLVSFEIDSKKSLYKSQIERLNLESPPSWGPELRQSFVALLAPVVAETSYELSIASNDDRYVDVKLLGNTRAAIRFRPRPRDGDIQVVFNGDTYELVKRKIGLPSNARPSKPQTPHVHCDLKKTWNIVCALVGKSELYEV